MLSMKRQFLVSLLFVVLVTGGAHSYPSSNDDNDEEKLLLNAKHGATNDDCSTVVNWQLVCAQLCSANLGGSACGEQCKTQMDADMLKYHQTALFGNSKTVICSELCANGMAQTACHCDANAATATTTQGAVCRAFCRQNNVTLSGCSECHQPRKTAKLFYYDATTPGSVPATENETTAPDWDKLCVDLCKVGEGGNLCNCDLPPFI